MLKVGDWAPAIEVILADNQELSLRLFRGKKVVIYFYPKDNTPECTVQACDFRDNLDASESQNVTILGVSSDTIQSHKNFAKKHSLPFPLISDPEHTISKTYGVWKEKKNYGKTYLGIERTSFVIDEHGKIIAIFSKVRVKGHIQKLERML